MDWAIDTYKLVGAFLLGILCVLFAMATTPEPPDD